MRSLNPFLVAASLSLIAPSHALAQSAAREGAASFLSNVSLSASGSAAWVENLSRSSNPLDMREAMVYDVNVAAAKTHQISRNWLLTAGADASIYSVPDFDRNTRYGVGVRGGLQRKFGLGPLAPVLSFNTSYAYQDARIDADDGATLTGSINLSKRIIPSLRVGATAEWLDHYARSATYDIQQRTLSIDATWDITERWRLSGSAGRLSGRLVATAGAFVWNRAITGLLGATIANYYNSVPWEVTDGYAPGWVSYNVESDVDLWSVGLARRFFENTSVELRLSSAYATNIVNVRYLTRNWAIGVAHRF